MRVRSKPSFRSCSWSLTTFWSVAALLMGSFSTAAAQPQSSPDFVQQIQPILNKYCVSCHSEDEREGELALDSFAALAAGGESGPAVVPADVAGSRLWRLVSGAAEPAMPPDDQPGPDAAELALIEQWIRSGAAGPSGEEPRPTRLVVPNLPPSSLGGSAITSVAWSPQGNRIAIGRYGVVELIDPTSREVVSRAENLPGKVNGIVFSPSGEWFATASGITGLEGQADLFQTSDGQRISSLKGHRDDLLAIAVSPDETRLATAGYDRTITLWNLHRGEVERELTGHNGAVFALDFDPSSSILLSASADQTLKVWRVADGERLDTLGQPLEEQWVGQFSADGQSMLGAGGDNRIRRWRLVSKETPAINPLELSRFAHEGPIVALAKSADGRYLASAAEDRTLKLWRAADLTEIHFLKDLPGIVTGLAFSPDGSQVVATSLDGSWQIYSVASIDEQGIDTEDSPANESAGDPAANSSEAGAPESESPTDTLPPDSLPLPVASINEANEAEPNDVPNQANPLTLPAVVAGILQSNTDQPDLDFFQFESEAGASWMIEVDAARSGSPVDSVIEVHDDQGVVPRVLLQAVRDSYFTFRGKDSSTSDDFRVHNWEEMELDEFLYANGEVVRLWLYPRGPDSGFKVYPGGGSRYNYFDTTPVAHALGAPCYIVKPHPIGTELIPNGLPVFTLPFVNDDDSRRRWGNDSRLVFTAPRAGTYRVMVRDVRGFGGDDYRYRLTVRPQLPDFQATLGGRDPQVAPGSGKEFSINVVRVDDFEGPIEVTINGLPEGFHATTPLIVEAHQDAAFGVIWADPTAVAPSPESVASISVVARAAVGDRQIEHDLGNFGNVTLAPAGKIQVRIVEAGADVTSADATEATPVESATPWPAEAPLELTISPGETISARVLVRREGFDGGVPFGNEDSGRNLPHGVFIDNIGLNGLLVIEQRTERNFFITAAPIASAQSRWFFLKARTEGEPCSIPVLLHVVPRP